MQLSGTGLSPCVWSRGRACGLVEAGRVTAASLTGPGGVCMGPSRRHEHWVQGDGRLPSPPLPSRCTHPSSPFHPAGVVSWVSAPAPPHRHLPGPLGAGVGVSGPLGRHPLPAVARWRLRNGAGGPRPPCPPPPGAPHTWKPPGRAAMQGRSRGSTFQNRRSRPGAALRNRVEEGRRGRRRQGWGSRAASPPGGPLTCVQTFLPGWQGFAIPVPSPFRREPLLSCRSPSQLPSSASLLPGG